MSVTAIEARVSILTKELDALDLELFTPALRMIPEGAYCIEPTISNKMQDELKTHARRVRLIPLLASMAKERAVAPPQFKRGLAALGKSGRIYFAHNMQFPGCLPSSYVSPVQFLLVLARRYQEPGFAAIAFSDELTGKDRDFIPELCLVSKCTVHIAEKLEDSESFVSTHPGLLTIDDGFQQATVQTEEELNGLAQCVANISHAPLTQAKCGAVIQTMDTTCHTGYYVETPRDACLEPLQHALISMIVSGRNCDQIQRVVLARPHKQTLPFRSNVESILATIAPNVHLEDIYF